MLSDVVKFTKKCGCRTERNVLSTSLNICRWMQSCGSLLIKYGINHILSLWLFKRGNTIGLLLCKRYFCYVAVFTKPMIYPVRAPSQTSGIGWYWTCKMFMSECLPGNVALGALLSAWDYWYCYTQKGFGGKRAGELGSHGELSWPNS